MQDVCAHSNRCPFSLPFAPFTLPLINYKAASKQLQTSLWSLSSVEKKQIQALNFHSLKNKGGQNIESCWGWAELAGSSRSL